MKKTYATPALLSAGDVVEQTQQGAVDISERTNMAGKNPLAGSVGYFL